MALSVTKTQQPKTLSQVLKYELSEVLCRLQRTVLGGSGSVRTLDVGEVVGRQTLGAPIITPGGGNTGNGVLGTLTYGNTAKVGSYTVTCFVATANAGTFKVVDPDGYRLADAEAGVAYVSPQLNFTITDGPVDWIVGDSHDITIAEGNGKVVELSLTATDGTQIAYGICSRKVVAQVAVDTEGFFITRDSLVAGSGLVWPVAISVDQKTAALASLANSGIRTVEG